MPESADLRLNDQSYPLPILTGTEKEQAIDISQLRKLSKFITFDDGYGNTGSCESSITFIDGDKGILRYRGYDISDLAEKSNFLETCYLLIYGDLPTPERLQEFNNKIAASAELTQEVVETLRSLPKTTHPMAALACGIQSLGVPTPPLHPTIEVVTLKNSTMRPA